MSAAEPVTREAGSRAFPHAPIGSVNGELPEGHTIWVFEEFNHGEFRGYSIPPPEAYECEYDAIESEGPIITAGSGCTPAAS